MEDTFGFTETIPAGTELANYFLVYLNGTLIGVVPRGESPYKLMRWLVAARKKDLDPTVGISVDPLKQCVYINTDNGRLMVPLIPARYILEGASNGELRAAIMKVAASLQEPDFDAWTYLLKGGYVELYDPLMFENVTVAFSISDLLRRRKECTHLQLPVGHCGIILAQLESADMNMGARAIYVTNHVKQAMGATIHNPFSMYHQDVRLLRGGQRSLVRSEFEEIIGTSDYPYTHNVLIAFRANVGNQSDEVGVNQAMVDRDAFTIHHTVTDTIRPEAVNAAFGVPPFDELYSPVASPEAYQKVDPIIGIPTGIGTHLKYGDVKAAITIPLLPKASGESKGGETRFTRQDISEIYKQDHNPHSRYPSPGIVTAAVHSIGKNTRTQLLQTTAIRKVQNGDKFGSRHGQKGIGGPPVPECDVPYNADGLRPSIEFNPPAAFRRETHGQITVALIGMVAALYGTSISMTPFLNRVYTYNLGPLLEPFGISQRGTQPMYNPLTGELFQQPIFMGCLAYMRLIRLIDTLRQYRFDGPRELFSQQPVKGAARQGGVAVGEMERNAMLASNSTLLTRDCFFEQAAPSKRFICDRCMRLAYASPDKPGLITCDGCGDLDPSVSHSVRMPYACPLLSSLLEGSGIALETKTEDTSDYFGYDERTT